MPASACYSYANIARTGRLETETALIGVVEYSKDLESDALAQVSSLAGTDAANCDRGAKLTPYDVNPKP